MTDDTGLRCRAEDGVAIIAYDRQHRRNAWDLSLYRALVQAVERANEDPALGAIVLCAMGPVFCAGVDLKAPPEPRDPVTGVRPNMATESMAEGQSWLHLVARSKPIVAAIQGPAIGAGVTQLLPLDIRIASEEASFAFRFLELGTMPELGATALLPQLVGHGRASDLMLSARTIDAHEAERIGLVNRVVPADALMETATALARRIAGFRRDAVRITKAMIEDNRLVADPDVLLARERSGFVEQFRLMKAERAAAQDDGSAPQH